MEDQSFWPKFSFRLRFLSLASATAEPGCLAAPAAGPLFTALVLFASCFVMPLMSCLKKCKQLWALGQVQGVHCTLHTAHTLRTAAAGEGQQRSSNRSTGWSRRAHVRGADCPTDQRPLLIRDVCLPWHCMKAASCRGCSCSCCCFCSGSQRVTRTGPIYLVNAITTT